MVYQLLISRAGARAYDERVSDDSIVLTQLLRDRLPMAFADMPVLVAYLFGSHARGTSTPLSDVDLAVHLGQQPSLDLVLGLARRVQDTTGVEADLTMLDEAPLRLVHRVLRDGVVVYSADEPARVRFETTMRPICADFEIFAEPLDRLLLRLTAQGRR